MNRMQRYLAALGVAAAACISSAPAFAHAFLDHASPAVGSVVHAAPRQVRVWFTQPLEPAFSSVRVLDASGKPVDSGDSHVEVEGDTSTVSVSLPSLAPGTYKVVWRAVSVDTHVTEGDFTFTVAA